MPSTSEKQRRAMAAAAHGKSTIGIPQSVGKEFHEADKQRAHANALRKKAKRKRKKPNTAGVRG